MATCRDTITRGLQMAGVIALGDEATSSEADMGMDVFQSLYDSWFEAREFGTLEDVYKTSDATAKEQERITTPSGVVVTLPDTIGTGAAARAPYLLSSVQTVIGGAKSNFIFEHSGWVTLEGLTLNSAAPLSSFGDMGLAACLALHWTGLFGGQIPPGSKLLSDRFVAAFRTAREAAHPPISVDYY